MPTYHSHKLSTKLDSSCWNPQRVNYSVISNNTNIGIIRNETYINL